MPLSAEEQEKQEQTPEKLAIGGDSGFQVDSHSYNIAKQSELVLLGSSIKIPLPCSDLPELVINAINAIQVTTACIALIHIEPVHLVLDDELPVSY